MAETTQKLQNLSLQKFAETSQSMQKLFWWD